VAVMVLTSLADDDPTKATLSYDHFENSYSKRVLFNGGRPWNQI
jgi:hypothetical protein